MNKNLMMNTTIKIPELLAPAGNMERLIAAFRYGADAVYVGASVMSLRNFADNFTFEELKQACDYAHARNKKVYLACNAFARDSDIETLPGLLKSASDCNVDALIVNDPGVIYVAKRVVPQLSLHLSTQANTLNTASAMFWYEHGVRRIIVARELSLKQIRVMRDKLPDDLEIEAFVHGAMCISYSGRCLLSNYLTGRDSNRGECAQPCRWTYEIRETGKNGEYFPIVQDELGTHMLNSRDMNLIEHLPEILEAGICSLKIEGRMKSVLYVATVVNAYRMALNAYVKAVEDGIPYVLPIEINDELNNVSHRPYTTGFAFGDPKERGQMPITSKYISEYEISAVVLSYDKNEKEALIRQRNRFYVGDTLSILSPNNIGREFVVEKMTDDERSPRDVAPHPNEHLYINCSIPLCEGDILRKKYMEGQDEL